MELIRAFNKLIAPYARRIYLMIGRGVVKLIDDSGGLQRLQVTLLDGEPRSNVERFQNYGHTANPPPGAEGIAASVISSRDHLVMIALDHPKYRKTGLKPGEGGLYDDQEQLVMLLREGVLVEGKQINLGGKRETLRALVDERILQLLTAHTHPVSGQLAGPTTTLFLVPAVCTETVKAK